MFVCRRNQWRSKEGLNPEQEIPRQEIPRNFDVRMIICRAEHGLSIPLLKARGPRMSCLGLRSTA